MAYVYNFCFYFSLRLGVIIIGLFSLIQAMIMIITASVGLHKTLEISKQIYEWRSENDFIFTKSIFVAVESDPAKYLILCLTIFIFYALSCIMLIYGAYACNTYMMYPYLIYECCRAILLFSWHVVAMLIVKQNVINLGLLIGLTVLGGFILLGIIYMWICVLSLIQLIQQLIHDAEIEKLKKESQSVFKPDIFPMRSRPLYSIY